MDSDFLKVMIVDDEEPVRGLFKIALDWDAMGMEVAGEASSASQALSMLEDIMPDIIFTDICMPFMDGLEFSRLVVERYPHIKIVVLTAYEEFDYAKKGIKAGLSDFLLKPINSGEIKKTALNVKEKINRERQHTEEYNSLKKRLDESYAYLLERFLNELVHNSLSSEVLEEKLAYFSFDPALKYHRVAVIEAVRTDINRRAGEEDRLILGMQCSEMVKLYFKGDAGLYVFFDINRRITVLNLRPEVDLAECAEQIKSMLINRLKCYASIGVGSACAGWKDVGASYKEACDALEYRIIAGWNQVIDFSEIDCGREKTAIRNADTGRIGMYVKSGAGEKAAGLIDDIFENIHTSRDINVEEIRTVSANTISSILTALNEIGLNYAEVFDPGLLPYNSIFRIDNLPEAREYVKGIALEAADAVRRLRAKKENSTIFVIMEYMREHLAEPDLTLAAVAGRFYKNPSYLSRIFKQETGQNFIEYLTKIRMEKAIEFLNGTGMRSYEIAEAVGIQDPNYFSMCFKKFAGMSVNDYKKNVRTL